MFLFFQVYFEKSEFGHYFCPFFTFPKKSWKNKNTNLYNKWIYLLKEKKTYSMLVKMIKSAGWNYKKRV